MAACLSNIVRQAFAWTPACVALLLVWCTAAEASADGKMFAREQIPPGIPYQRALIVHKDQRQSMVLQTAFDPKASADTIGWVVPLPSVPELAALGEGEGERLFMLLDMGTAPQFTRVSSVLLLGLVAILFLTLVGGLMILAVPRWRRRFDRSMSRPVTTVVALSGVWLLLIGLVLPALGSARGTAGVEILKKEQVGVFDASVIRAENPEDLTAWLDEHGFAFSPDDRAVLQEHIDRGWCFVVALVRSDERDAMIERNRERLVDPLVMTFDAPVPVYPLALTATAGSDTMVLLYLLSDQRWSDGGRLPLRAARPMDPAASLLRLLPDSIAAPSEGWLCKFRGTLTPAQMATDLVFTASSDSVPYRERLVRW